MKCVCTYEHAWGKKIVFLLQKERNDLLLPTCSLLMRPALQTGLFSCPLTFHHVPERTGEEAKDVIPLQRQVFHSQSPQTGPLKEARASQVTLEESGGSHLSSQQMKSVLATQTRLINVGAAGGECNQVREPEL